MNKLDIRNTPMDRLSYLSAKLLMCAKYGCVGAAGTGTTITTFAGLDSILELAGHKPIFLQSVADIGNKVLEVENARTEYLKQKQIISNITTVNQRFMKLKEATKEVKSLFNNSGIFSKEELDELLIEISKEAYNHRKEGLNLSNDLQTSLSKSEILRELNSKK